MKYRKYSAFFIILLTIPSFSVFAGNVTPPNSVNRMISNQDTMQWDYASKRTISKVIEAANIEWETPSYEPSYPVPVEENNGPARDIYRGKPSKDLNNSEVVVLYDKFEKENALRQGQSIPDALKTSVLPDVSTLDAIYYPSEPTKDYPQPPLTPAKDGHWFQKQSYSVLAFQFTYPAPISTLDVWMYIERDQDIYV